MPNADLRATFQERGYIDPVRLFSPRECRAILARLNGLGQQAPPDWDKAHAAASSEYFVLGTDDQILDLVTALIGEDVLLWGASLVVRRHGQVHVWHTDIESSSPTAETVSVWIGLTGTNARSSLKVVPFSHRFGAPVQQVMQEHGASRRKVTDADVASWARDRDDRSGVVPIEATDGEAVLFDGRLWHGSHNLNSRGSRHAVLLQYATPATPIRIPNFRRLTWPFEVYSAPRPACIVVNGRDMRALNRLVPGPATSSDHGSPALSTRVHALKLPLAQNPQVGWKPHDLFAGATASVSKMGCHVSILDPGRQPHPPHRHAEEEILVILDGEADLVVEDGQDASGTSPHRARRGTFAYYPAEFAHTIHNTATAPVTYVMFKWTSDRAQRGDVLPHRLVPFPESTAEPASARGMSQTQTLNGETAYLRRLHAHVTTLVPGAGYEPHVDAYDVAVVVLDGVVETLGERLTAPAVVFYAGGEPHGMRNPGDAPAVYIVFEFHGRRSMSRQLQSRSFWLRLLRLARDPRRLRGALVHYARLLRSRLGV